LPCYLGDKYANGIEVLYLVNGKKLTLTEYYYDGGAVNGIIDNIENIKPTILSPDVTECCGSFGNYFIDCSRWDLKYYYFDEQPTTYTYIRYPDGSEDEIKVHYYRVFKNSLIVPDKIWVKGELALSMDDNLYYNPKFFPRLKTLLLPDDDGNLTKEVKVPETYMRLLWIVKSNPIGD